MILLKLAASLNSVWDTVVIIFSLLLEFIRNGSNMIDIADIKNRIVELSKSRPIKHGLPFVLFIVGASFGLKEFTNLRYQYRKTQQFKGKLEEVGFPMKKPEEKTLEATYETVKELDTDNWENKRIARPWEEETVKT